jgi:hypothetical protein
LELKISSSFTHFSNCQIEQQRGGHRKNKIREVLLTKNMKKTHTKNSTHDTKQFSNSSYYYYYYYNKKSTNMYPIRCFHKLLAQREGKAYCCCCESGMVPSRAPTIEKCDKTLVWARNETFFKKRKGGTSP